MQYKYDSMGNIIEVLENGRSACRYEYDALGRLTREDNVAFGKTTTWAYDNNGNIIARYEYAITAKPTSELHLLDCKEFIYCYADNSDQLRWITDVADNHTETFEYDDIGNPKKYKGESATWQYGRQLTAYDGNTFSYDARGRRTAKNGITFTYDSNGNLIKQSNGLEFLYDHTGVFAVKYNNTTYFYRKDAQANIVELLDSNGDTVVKYKYDAWGKCHTTVVDSTAGTIGELNPFRYRSYYLDTETGFYFLKTRYYDPEIGRFMTIDDISYLDPESINGLNLYAYCNNNPVMYSDPSGHLAITTMVIIGALLGAAFGAGINAGMQLYHNGGDLSALNFGSIAKSAIIGAGLGVAFSLGVSYLGPILAAETVTSLMIADVAYALATSVFITFSAGVLGFVAEQEINGNSSWSTREAIQNGILVAVEGIHYFHTGGLIGSFGHIGTKGPFLSKEWFLKFTVSQAFNQLFKHPLEKIFTMLKDI
jgi:RHS repeat-associated protein